MYETRKNWRKVQGSNKRAQFIDSDWRLLLRSVQRFATPRSFIPTLVQFPFSTIDATTKIPGVIDIDEFANVTQEDDFHLSTTQP